MADKPREFATLDQPVTGEQVRMAMMLAEIERVDHHDCCICNQTVFYSRDNDKLYFHYGCGCSWSPPEERTWDDAAAWINMQQLDTRRTILERFGFVVTKNIPVTMLTPASYSGLISVASDESTINTCSSLNTQMQLLLNVHKAFDTDAEFVLRDLLNDAFQDEAKVQAIMDLYLAIKNL